MAEKRTTATKTTGGARKTAGRKKKTKKPKVTLSPRKVYLLCAVIICLCGLSLALSVITATPLSADGAAPMLVASVGDVPAPSAVATASAAADADAAPAAKKALQTEKVAGVQKGAGKTEKAADAKKNAAAQKKASKAKAVAKAQTASATPTAAGADDGAQTQSAAKANGASATTSAAGAKSASAAGGATNASAAVATSPATNANGASATTSVAGAKSASATGTAPSASAAVATSSAAKADGASATTSASGAKSASSASTAAQAQSAAAASASRATTPQAPASQSHASGTSSGASVASAGAAVTPKSATATSIPAPDTSKALASLKPDMGTQPQALSDPFKLPQAKNGATLVFVIDDAGLHVENVRRYTALPFPITIAVLPKLAQTKACAEQIRKDGKELMLHQPMQAENLAINPGAGKISPNMTTYEIAAQIRENLAELGGGVKGFNNHEGSLITGDAIKMGAVLETAAGEGVYFLDSRTTAASKARQAALERDMRIFERNAPFLDNAVNREEMLAEIRKGLDVANKAGHAVIIGHVDKSVNILPKLLEELYPYLLQKGYRFATPSTL